MYWYLKVLKNYANFSGRARRKEFWMFGLIHFIIMMVLYGLIIAAGALGGEEGTLMLAAMGLYGLYALFILIPGIAVIVRRLHDIGRTGTWWLIGFVPFIGAIVLLIFAVTDSEPGANQYGENPKEADPDMGDQPSAASQTT